MSKSASVAIRNPDLDGLRGIAALSVALGHCYEQVTGLALWGTSLKNFPTMPTSQVVMRILETLFPSDAAVMVFFALSGHVLWESFRRKDMLFFRDLPEYTAARLYRLLPLTIASGLLLGFFTSAPAYELARNMLLFSHSLNGVLWSLQAEIVASGILFLLWGLTKGSTWKMLLGLAVSIAALPFCRGNPLIMFLPAFILGAGVTSIPKQVWRSRSLLAAAILALLFANVLLGHGGVDRCVEMGAAAALVGAVSQGQLPFLRWRLPLFLGAISYPFYLTHLIGLLEMEPFLNALPPMSPYLMIAARAAASIGVTIPLAWLLHVFVENPLLRARPRIRGWAFAWDGFVRPDVRTELSGLSGSGIGDSDIRGR
ncbi:acyltransferase family protein [Rhodopila sp.]|uniref:acyltransferase family protein n=1 Tax=Rhodopila sp. TaxID=2480087 RepID=UPI003D10F135